MRIHRHRWAFFATTLVLFARLATVAPAQGLVPPFDAPVLAGDLQTHFRCLLDYDADGAVDAMSAYFSAGTLRLRGYRNVNGLLAPDWSVTYPGIPGSGEPKAEVATADFNGDGKGDFVLTVNESFGIWLSNGAGVVPTLVTGGSEPNLIDQVLATDFNGDGLPDLAFREGLELRILLTQPSGPPVMTSSVTITTLPVTARIFLVDADGDGVQDIATVRSGYSIPTEVVLYLVPAGLLQPAGTYSTVSTFTNLQAEPTAGDVDGDGDQDIVLFGQFQAVVLRRLVAATFIVESPFAGGFATSLADFDHDGDLDAIGIAVATYSGFQQSTFTVALNDGTGLFSQKGPFPCSAVNSFEDPGRIAGAADLDQDGDVDLVAGNCVYYGRGSATNTGFGTSAYGPRDIADLDGDGDPDAVPGVLPPPSLASNPSVATNRGDGTFAAAVTFAPPAPAGFQWRGPGFPGDFDGDGDVDFLVDTVTGFGTTPVIATHLLRNLGCGVFVDQGLATPSGAVGGSVNPQIPQSSLAADVDGDWDLDLIVGDMNSNSGTKIWWNQGAGVFLPGPQFPQTRIVAVADLNLDGMPDLVMQAYPTLLVVYFGQPSGFAPPVNIDVDSFASAVADFDGDGDPDVFSVGTYVSELYANNGDGTFASPVHYPDLDPAVPPFLFVTRRVFAVDVDADGLTDVVSLSPYALRAGMAILFRNGPGGTFGSVVRQVLQPTAFTDLDGDGDPDAVGNINVPVQFVGRNLRFVLPSSGARLQYGSGTAGTGAIAPILGESGPFRAGASCVLRITGGVGGASGLLGVGFAPDSLPFAGITLLVVPSLTVPVQLGGTPGLAGEGSLALSLVMPPSLVGSTVFHQAGFADAAGPAGFSATNGLRIDVGP